MKIEKDTAKNFMKQQAQISRHEGVIGNENTKYLKLDGILSRGQDGEEGIF